MRDAVSGGVTLVCGPPGGGKSYWARMTAPAGSSLFDGDQLLAATLPAGARPRWDTPRRQLRDALFRAACASGADSGLGLVRITAPCPTRAERAVILAPFRHRGRHTTLVLVLPPDAATALARIRADVHRRVRPRGTRRAVWERMVARWYERLEWPDPAEADEVIVVSS